MEAKLEFKNEMSVTFCGQHILVSTGKFDNVLRNQISIIMETNAPCKALRAVPAGVPGPWCCAVELYWTETSITSCVKKLQTTEYRLVV